MQKVENSGKREWLGEIHYEFWSNHWYNLEICKVDNKINFEMMGPAETTDFHELSHRLIWT